jgi:membrane protein YdbS with pleckstrin-like domain
MGTEPDLEEWHRPSPRLWRLRSLQLVLIAALLLLVAGVAVWLGAPPEVLVAAVLLPAVAAVPVRRRWLAWGYRERADDLLVRRGLLVRRLSVVPYGRMQFVDVTAGPLDRRFGLATVHLHTAAAARDARIPGLTSAEATRLRDRLAALGEARAAGL